MSAAFKQNAPAQTITSATTFDASAPLTFLASNMGAIRVCNNGNQFADICLTEDPAVAATPSTWHFKMIPNSVEVFGPFVGPVYANARTPGGAGNTIEFTPGTGGV